MADYENELNELLEKLKQGRDELNVKIHLGKAEAKDLWQETEDKWRHLRSELDSDPDPLTEECFLVADGPRPHPSAVAAPAPNHNRPVPRRLDKDLVATRNNTPRRTLDPQDSCRRHRIHTVEAECGEGGFRIRRFS